MMEFNPEVAKKLYLSAIEKMADKDAALTHYLVEETLVELERQARQGNRYAVFPKILKEMTPQATDLFRQEMINKGFTVKGEIISFEI